MSTKRKTFSLPAEPPREINKMNFYGIELDDEQLEFANAIWDKDVDIVFCDAKAGSGKTLVATGIANLLVQYGFFDKIYYIVSPYGEKRMGYLPGSLREKSEIYFEPFFQALVKIGVNPYTAVNDDSMENQKTGSGYIECVAETFLRGTNLENSVIILDETQNYSVDQLKKTLTRVCPNTKVLAIGHHLQCDMDHPDASGFVAYLNHFKGQERARICKLTTNHRGWVSRWADEF